MTIWVVPTEASKARVPQAKQSIDSPLVVCHLNSANPNPMSDAPHQAGKLALNEPVECDCNLGSRNFKGTRPHNSQTSRPGASVGTQGNKATMPALYVL